MNALPMKPESKSKQLLRDARSLAKMLEYNVPAERRPVLSDNPGELLTLAVSLLGELAADINSPGLRDIRPVIAVSDIQFAALFFETHVDGGFRVELDSKFRLLAAACYYLIGAPGNSRVLINKVVECPMFNAQGLEVFVWWLLRGHYTDALHVGGSYSYQISHLATLLPQYLIGEVDPKNVFDRAMELRRQAYSFGTPEELFFADLACATLEKRIEYSAARNLPTYTNLPLKEWSELLKRRTFIRELWPAQHILGKSGVFSGQSAMVQMPTSAGKTRAVELIIRSSFLSTRTKLAVIVAPFRSLCHDIRADLVRAFRGDEIDVEEVADAPQMDSDLDGTSDRHRVVVITPEKLMYIIRHDPEVVGSIGLFIFDEGHQFDSGHRGVTYELLLTSLRQSLSEDVQLIVISAVLGNAEAVGEWLLQDSSAVVKGSGLLPTARSVAFASWAGDSGNLEFVQPSAPGKTEFSVNGIIQPAELSKLKKSEKKKRTFPKKGDGPSIGLYLGMRQVSRGSVAIFCGRKDTASQLCADAAEIYQRGGFEEIPAEYSNLDEVGRIAYLYQEELGFDSDAAACSRIGIFSHHGNTPRGIRLAVEHAMKDGEISFVICTSTLAQGVNLPIRYLIVSGLYQGKDQIKVRDFQNLMGRAGRAGMHTEGTVLFADSTIFDERKKSRSRWRWRMVTELLDPSKSESCLSSILELFSGIRGEKKKHHVPIDAVEFVKDYWEKDFSIEVNAKLICEKWEGFRYNDVVKQLREKAAIVAAIEGFLLSCFSDGGTAMGNDSVIALCRETLAYRCANEIQKASLENVFLICAMEIEERVKDAPHRVRIRRALLGVEAARQITDFLKESREAILGSSDMRELFDVLWPVVIKFNGNTIVRQLGKTEEIKLVAEKWIDGAPFYEMLEVMTGSDLRIGGNNRRPKVEDMVDLCENGFGFDASHIVGAAADLWSDDAESISDKISLLVKALRYGLPDKSSILVYEAGFADRMVAMDISALMPGISSRADVRALLTRDKKGALEILRRYPSYYSSVLSEITG